MLLKERAFYNNFNCDIISIIHIKGEKAIDKTISLNRFLRSCCSFIWG